MRTITDCFKSQRECSHSSIDSIIWDEMKNGQCWVRDFLGIYTHTQHFLNCVIWASQFVPIFLLNGCELFNVQSITKIHTSAFMYVQSLSNQRYRINLFQGRLKFIEVEFPQIYWCESVTQKFGSDKTFFDKIRLILFNEMSLYIHPYILNNSFSLESIRCWPKYWWLLLWLSWINISSVERPEKQVVWRKPKTFNAFHAINMTSVSFRCCFATNTHTHKSNKWCAAPVIFASSQIALFCALNLILSSTQK